MRCTIASMMTAKTMVLTLGCKDAFARALLQGLSLGFRVNIGWGGTYTGPYRV